jgi:arylsulfatase A-like enzyme
MRFTPAVGLSVLLASYLLCPACVSRGDAEPNVVLIVIDTLRSDHLSFYGYDQDTAPFLSGLARESAVFEKAYSASSWTSPATASIFTSLYPFQHGVLVGLHAHKKEKKINPDIEVDRLPEEATTITEVLKKAGYRTFGVSDNFNICRTQGFTQGFDRFKMYPYRGAAAVNNLVEKWRQEIQAGGKYFLYLHYMDPHSPYHKRGPWYREDTSAPVRYPVAFQKRGRRRLSAAERRSRALARYDSEIGYVDDHIKRLFDLFGWKENTLLIVTSDHGEGLWDHGISGHANTLYREEIQVPFLVYFPGGMYSRRVEGVVSTLDILPTVRAALSLPSDPGDEGLDLMPLIRNGSNGGGGRVVFSHLIWKKVIGREVEIKSAVRGDWHWMERRPLAWRPGEVEIGEEWRSLIDAAELREVYDLSRDPGEGDNLMPSRGKTAAPLKGAFQRFYVSSLKHARRSVRTRLDPEKLKQLKSLGYMH